MSNSQKYRVSQLRYLGYVAAAMGAYAGRGKEKGRLEHWRKREEKEHNSKRAQERGINRASESERVERRSAPLCARWCETATRLSRNRHTWHWTKCTGRRALGLKRRAIGTT
eukprot:120388-Pleurochrysis_carterae.AAC.1